MKILARVVGQYFVALFNIFLYGYLIRYKID